MSTYEVSMEGAMRKGLEIMQLVLAYLLYAIGFVSNLGSSLTQGSSWDPATNSLKYPTRGGVVKARGAAPLPKLKID
jgi:hypothetical protein